MTTKTQILVFICATALFGVRDDYDHRTASVLIGQLEKHRSQLIPEEKEEDLAVSPLKAKKKA